MLYPTANQSLLLLVVALIGFGCGFVYNLATLCTYLCAKKVFAKQLFFFFATIFSFFIYFLTNLHLNYGLFRIFPIIEFLTFLILEIFTLGKLWTKWLDAWYDKVMAKRQTEKPLPDEKDHKRKIWKKKRQANSKKSLP